MRLILLFLSLTLSLASVFAQKASPSKAFSLASPNQEPDGRNDVVRFSNGDLITLAKTKGAMAGTSNFLLERYTKAWDLVWQVPLVAENDEDYKDIFFNGKELVLLSVVHNETTMETKLESYGFNPNDGSQVWKKELESYKVGNWSTHPHKGKVKEDFNDVVCEHANRMFVTPFEYKHNLTFSPDGSKFLSYVFNYGEMNLSASVAVYRTSDCGLIQKGIVGIDNDFTNHGIYINNTGDLFLLNVNNSSKVNLIRYTIETKAFKIIELAGSNAQRDDFKVHLLSNDQIVLGNTTSYAGKLSGFMYSLFDFQKGEVVYSHFKELDASMKAKVAETRKANAMLHGEENWMDYDLVEFLPDNNNGYLFVLEKRMLYAEGYPHIAKSTFDKSHKVEIQGHVQAEGILLVSMSAIGGMNWWRYVVKNQIYPANDGINTVSFTMDKNIRDKIRLMYAYSEKGDALISGIKFITINPLTGNPELEVLLENPEKLTLVREYTVWQPEGFVLVGRKGMMGKASRIVNYTY
jgi:hypothetical protein